MSRRGCSFLQGVHLLLKLGSFANGEPGEPGTAIYFVGPVFILALPLPRRR